MILLKWTWPCYLELDQMTLTLVKWPWPLNEYQRRYHVNLCSNLSRHTYRIPTFILKALAFELHLINCLICIISFLFCQINKEKPSLGYTNVNDSPRLLLFRLKLPPKAVLLVYLYKTRKNKGLKVFFVCLPT